MKNCLTKQRNQMFSLKKLIDQLLESMTYSSISFINWTIETLSLIKARLQRGDRITDEVSGEVYTLYSFQQFVEKNFFYLYKQARYLKRLLSRRKFTFL